MSCIGGYISRSDTEQEARMGGWPFTWWSIALMSFLFMACGCLPFVLVVGPLQKREFDLRHPLLASVIVWFICFVPLSLWGMLVVLVAEGSFDAINVIISQSIALGPSFALSGVFLAASLNRRRGPVPPNPRWVRRKHILAIVWNGFVAIALPGMVITLAVSILHDASPSALGDAIIPIILGSCCLFPLALLISCLYVLGIFKHLSELANLANGIE
jgi:hypothetical protein